MRYKKAKLIAAFLLGIGLTGLQAQESVTASGGNASGAGGTVSYSVGQVVYKTNTGSNGSEAQGVQQPYEISVIIGIEEAKYITLQCSVYPNPTNDFLVLKVENFNFSTINFQLYDINGKILMNNKPEGSVTNIAMSNLVPAIYFLKVFQGDKEIKTFKVIKN